MATVTEIRTEAAAAVQVLQDKIADAGARGIAGDPGMPEKLTDFARDEAAIAERAAHAMLNSADLDEALQKIRNATTDMRTTAAVMVSVTTFLSHASALTQSANKVAETLKSITKSA